jgi:hypothetical protein
MDMMRFDYTIVHRPERMMFECNLLSCYNTWTSKARKEDLETAEGHNTEPDKVIQEPEEEGGLTCLMQYIEQPASITVLPRTCLSVKTTWREEDDGKHHQPIKRTYMAELTDRMRDLGIIETEMKTATEAMRKVGLEARVTETTSEDDLWRAETNTPDVRKLRNKMLMSTTMTTEWLICPKADYILVKGTTLEMIQEVVMALTRRGLRAIIFCLSSNKAKVLCDTFGFKPVCELLWQKTGFWEYLRGLCGRWPSS